MIKITIAFCLIALGWQTVHAEQPYSEGNNMKDKKVLIAFYSKSGHTRQVAEYIREITGGDLFEIEPVTPYPADYRATTEQAKKEINEGYQPPIKAKVQNIADYDVVFVGSPCWWATIAPPVATFLTETDLSGKTVIPFSTHGGSGLANNAKDTAKLTPHSTVLKGHAFSDGSIGSAKAEVTRWIQSLE